MGDVVLCYPAVRRIRERYPDAEIGFLTQTPSRAVAESFPEIARVHVIDHWNLNRAALSMPARRAAYLKQRKAVTAEIAAAGYDIALDFYQHFPTASFELWKSRIPVRIGYDSGGLSPFLTHATPWTTDNRHVIERHGDLIALMPGSKPAPSLKAAYPVPDPAKLEALRAKGIPDRFVLIHTGTGGWFKEWPEEKWLELIAALRAKGERVVLAGAGAREAERNARLGAADPSILNLTNQLKWPEFTAAISRASLLIGLDSVAAHLAAGFGVPVICIRAGCVSDKVWGPFSPSAAPLTAPTPCAPCHREGCDTMACLNISPAEVLGAAVRLAPAGERVSSA